MTTIRWNFTMRRTAKNYAGPSRNPPAKCDFVTLQPCNLVTLQLCNLLTMKLRLFLFLLTLSIFNAAADFRAAIAVRAVTPDPLLPVVGGVGPGSKVTRKEGDLTVRALVLEDGSNRIAIVSA